MTRRSIHVAAMPFPSPQGTQGAIGAMLDALHAAGEAPELWTYAHGDPSARATPYPVHRLWDVPRDRSLRSGPSWRKALLDAQLATRLRSIRTSEPLIAHHVEAAAAAWLARQPYVFFAHTDLGAELPSYSPQARPLRHTVLRAFGEALDHTLIAHARHVAAISPMLCQQLARLTSRPIHYIPTPWPAREACDDEVRHAARRALGLATAEPVVLYAGNLDAYQGWQDVIDACALVRVRHPSLRLLIATESAHAPLLDHARARGEASHITWGPLATEADRARCHAAADVCVVPRRIPGGLPIKLLEALSRRVPTIAPRRAIAGLPLDKAVSIVPNDAPDAIAAAIDQLLSHAQLRDQQIARGSAYLRVEHSPSKFLAALRDVRAA